MPTACAVGITAATSFADEWTRLEAPGVHVGYVSTGSVLFSVICSSSETGNASGIGLRIRGVRQGTVRIRIDEGDPREFELMGGSFGAIDQASAALFEAIVADLRAGAFAVVEVSGVRETVPLGGSARAIGSCPASF